MADLRVVSWTGYHNRRWMKPSSFGFARQDQMVTIGLHEVAKVMTQLPIALARHENAYLPVALMGVAAGQNLVVSHQGQWLADYVPTLYRGYPFRMAKDENGRFVLCVDHASGLVHDKIAGFRFFQDEKKPSPETSAVMNMLMELENGRAALTQICALLDEQGVIESWPVRIQTATGTQEAPNLYRISEAKLNQLPAETLVALRNLGGLILAYGQLFSMQQLQPLGNIAQRQSWTSKTEQGGKTPSLNIGEEEGIVSFANL